MNTLTTMKATMDEMKHRETESYEQVKQSVNMVEQAQLEKTQVRWLYTLSHLENDRDVSTYSGGRRLSSRAQLVCFLTRSKRNTGIDA